MKLSKDDSTAIVTELVAHAALSFALKRENWPAFRAHLIASHPDAGTNPVARLLCEASWEQMAAAGLLAQRAQEKRALAPVSAR